MKIIMNSKNKRTIKWGMMFVLTMLVMMISMTASALSPSFPVLTKLVYEPKGNNTVFVYGDVPNGAVIKNVKSSNRAVVTAKPFFKGASTEEGSLPMITFTARKAGKSVVTFDVAYGNGKTKHLKTTVKVTNYQSPIASIKINGRELAYRFRKKSNIHVKLKRTRENTFSIKVKKGWKLVNFYNGYTGDTISSSRTFTVKYPDILHLIADEYEAYSIYAKFYNIKTGEQVFCNIDSYPSW